MTDRCVITYPPEMLPSPDEGKTGVVVVCSALKELIERLEKATGPNRALDMAIFTTVVQPFAEPFKEYRGTAWISHDESTTVPRYTGSIDAALTLVPEGWTWVCGDGGIMQGDPGDKRYGAMCYGEPTQAREASSGVAPAIAICIAALKALEASA